MKKFFAVLLAVLMLPVFALAEEAPYVTEKVDDTLSITVNVPEGYTVTAESDSVSNVTIIGTSEVMETLAATDLVAEVDMDAVEIAEGRMSVAVNIYAPSKGQLWAYGEYTVTVNVSKN